MERFVKIMDYLTLVFLRMVFATGLGFLGLFIVDNFTDSELAYGFTYGCCLMAGFDIASKSIK